MRARTVVRLKKPKTVKTNTKENTKTKKAVRRPAISTKLKTDIIKHSNQISRYKVEISKLKISEKLLNSKFSELNRIHNKLHSMEIQTRETLEYLKTEKLKHKPNPILLKHEAMLEKFYEGTNKKRKGLINALDSKLHSLYSEVVKAQEINVRELSKKQQSKLIEKIASNFNIYQHIVSSLPNIDFSGPKGGDLRKENMKKIIERINSKIHR